MILKKNQLVEITISEMERYLFEKNEKTLEFLKLEK